MQKTVRTSQPKVARSGLSQSAQVLPKLKGYVSLRSLASQPPIRNSEKTASRSERPSVPSGTPPLPQILSEKTGHSGIFSQSKAKDFRMCYIAFARQKLPSRTPAATIIYQSKARDFEVSYIAFARQKLPSRTPAATIIYQSKARDFGVSYIAFARQKLPSRTPAATTQRED